MSSLETEGCPLLFLRRAVWNNLFLETLEYLVIFEEFLNRNYVSRAKEVYFLILFQNPVNLRGWKCWFYAVSPQGQARHLRNTCDTGVLRHSLTRKFKFSRKPMEHALSIHYWLEYHCFRSVSINYSDKVKVTIKGLIQNQIKKFVT